MCIKKMKLVLKVINKLNGKFYKVSSIQESIGMAMEMVMDDDGCWTGAFGEDEKTC